MNSLANRLWRGFDREFICHNRFALRLQRNQVLIDQLNGADKQAWNLLGEGPLDIDALADTHRALTRAVARLERMGLVIYSGFTPSDATHVLGMNDHWSTEAASLAAQLWARQMRYLYGCGDWSLDDPKEPSEAVLALVIQKISHKLIEAGLNQHGLLNEAHSRNLAGLLGDVVLSESTKSPLFDLRFASDYPLVGVGGPAADFLPEVARKLGMSLVLPDHADTANALGAVMALVVQRVTVTVTQPKFGKFCVFYGSEPSTFKTLKSALEYARATALAAASEQAMSSGAESVTTQLEESREHVDHDIDGELFLSATIVAIASGRPMRSL
jgi:N-methylhydantoinase A/oxoprolinase/acetone carboxylase beta subunit